LGTTRRIEFFRSLLGILLLAAAIYLLVKSPKKLQTLGRMVVAFVVTLLLFIVPGAILRMGDPQGPGKNWRSRWTAYSGYCRLVAHALY
jgi:hypothetical protein